MTALTFTPAVRHEAKARVAIIGPTGAGKTWTALDWATVLGDRVAVIDTENGSASLYSDQYTFDTATWPPPYDATRLVGAIRDAANTYDVIVIDSLTHFWQGDGGVLDVVDKAAARARGNQFAGWKEGTPVWRALLDSLIFAPCHVIVTMRSKMEYIQQERDGRKTVEKVGMAPVARNDVEYEFTVVGDMDQAHKMTVTKSRCSLLDNEVALANQSQRLAVVLRDWLSTAAAAPPPAPPAVEEAATAGPSDAQIRKMMASFGELDIKTKPDRLAVIAAIVRPVESSKDLGPDEASKVIDVLAKAIAGRVSITWQDDGSCAVAPL